MFAIWMRRVLALQIVSGLLTFGALQWVGGVADTEFHSVMRDSTVLWAMILVPLALSAVGSWLAPRDEEVGPYHSGRSEAAMLFMLGLGASFGAGILFFGRMMAYAGLHPTLLTCAAVAAAVAGYLMSAARRLAPR